MDFRELVELLDRKGMLAHVRKPVDCRYEVSTLIKLLKGRPVMFHDVKGQSIPVVSNVCSNRTLVGLGLGIPPRELMGALARSIEHPVAPVVLPHHDYQELPTDLTRLPIPTHYPEDGGPYIASGVAVAHDREYGTNLSYHRAMILGPDRMVLRLVERHLHHYKQRGLKEFAFCIGNPTSVMIAGAISVELGRSELEIAHALRDTPVVQLGGHVVPRSELVLLCEFTGEQTAEGPFLDLTETFDVVRQQGVVAVKQVLARPNAMYHALLPGDLEHKTLMGMPREPTIFREVNKVCECLDVFITPGGCSWLHAVIKIRKRSEEDGRKAIEAAMRGHASLKHAFVVDEDVDVEDSAQVEWALATRFQGHRGLHVFTGQQGSSLDPSSDMATKQTTKVGFDLTAPLTSSGKSFVRPALPLQINLADYLD